MTTRGMKAFISHAHEDRELARTLKKHLDEIGIQAFLAHDDIHPAATWAAIIQTELRTCDVFLPILTRAFTKSDWTDQETGAAVGMDKLIVPLQRP